MEPTRRAIADRPPHRHGEWLLLVAIVLVLGAVVILIACGGTPPIAEKAVGWWQEVGTTKAFTMHVTSTGPYRYSIVYRRHFLVPFDARRVDDKLVVVDMSEVMLTVTYDAKTDQLTAVGLDRRPITLRRIPAPSASAP